MKKIFLILSTFISFSATATNADSVLILPKLDDGLFDGIYNNSIYIRKYGSDFSKFIVKITNLSNGKSNFYTYTDHIDIVDTPTGLYLLEVGDDKSYLTSRKIYIKH